MRFPLTSLVFLALGSALQAQYAPTLDAKSMLANLQQMRVQRSQSAKSLVDQTIRDFSAAAANDESALEFYEQAIQVTRFAGENREQTAFHDWKKKEAEHLKSQQLQDALRVTLSYLALSMQKLAGATDEQLLPSLVNYAEQTQGLLPTLGDQEIIHQSISGDIFARWYNVGGQLGGLQNWEQVPANVDGIYNQTILPFMRKNHDPRIVQYWDNKIVAEGSVANGRAFDADVFANTRKPTLLWSRANDMLTIGQRDQAIAEMYNVIKSFPNHPEAGKWIDQLQGILGAPPSGSSAPAPAGAH